MSKLDELRTAMYEAHCVYREAYEAKNRAEDLYAEALAESIGLKIGSVVIQRHRGQIKRYRVTRLTFCSYAAIKVKLIGRRIRKDGSDGSSHQSLYGDWELESAPATGGNQ